MPKRDYIPFKERLASALAEMLPEDVRADLRRRRVPADDVISLFEKDSALEHALQDAAVYGTGYIMLTSETTGIEAHHMDCGVVKKIDVPKLAEQERQDD